MNAERLLEVYDQMSEAPDAIARLRRFVLDLAVRGKLVEQDAGDEPAARLVQRIEDRKAEILSESGLRKPRKVADMDPAEIWADLPANWAWSQISNLGFISPRNEADDHVEASFVPMPMISTEYGVANDHEVRPWAEIKKGYTHFAEGDVGLAKITPCFENGKSTVFRNLTGGFGSGTTELHILRPVLVDPDFVVLFLKSPQFIETGIPKMTGTAGQKRVSSEYFTSSPFPLPPLAEQHRIVAKVDELMALCDRLAEARKTREEVRDKLTAASFARLTPPDTNPEDFPTHAAFVLEALPALTTRPDQIKTLRQTILNLAVRGKLVEQDLADEPASELLKAIEAERHLKVKAKKIRTSKPLAAIRNDELPFDLPSGWVWVRLGNIIQLISGQHLQPSEYSENIDEGLPYITGPSDFGSNGAVVRRAALVRKAVAIKGQLLITVKGSGVGKAMICDLNEVAISRQLMAMEPLGWEIGFLELIADRLAVKLQEEARSLIPGISREDISEFVVALPPLAEQHRIVAKVDALMALCDRLEAALTTTDTTRIRLLEALLHEALNPATDALEAVE
ncbi:restriction endonuclease subunit S [Pararhodobacter marinus]|uniref:Restriction endonuclease subunit S n=1 Tax=Pararhodobacter marinus TaxID=2184063 RepID=A0A2U2CEG2_9RHOB|nr:restriction endonuclease subunit S [Pararhodobacter marinus]PWE30276.1 restriction endonuclease subunit S [Pararhodobacter marinus]